MKMTDKAQCNLGVTASTDVPAFNRLRSARAGEKMS